jgi:hypothetical protein
MKIHYFWGVLLFFILLMPAVVSAESIVHPSLLFDNIKDTPGYKYSTVEPWKSYQNQILRSADTSLGYNFSGSLGVHDRIMYRGSYAQDLGLAYQITKNPKYAKKAQEALINLDKGTVSYKVDKSGAIASYSLAYDFIQPTLDPATDTLIRDKLATLTDSGYRDLNENGTKKNYVSFADYHGQAYPNMGIAGAALADYTNPNNLPLSSTPEDWHKVGTDYLFIDDKLHSYGRSLFSFGFDEISGKHLNGAYKSYVLDDFMVWLQVYNHFYHENPFEKYPAAKRAFTSELWESLPNGYSNNYVTLGNTKWTYHRDIVNLLDDNEKASALNYDESLEKSKILPYTRSLAGASATILYCVYENYTAIPRSYPSTTSHLDINAIYQVFRGSWKPDTDWLSIITWNYLSNSNRDMAHNDQASIEYYSRGDLLLADAGEDKYVLNTNYGAYEIHHNTIAIENPRNPFTIAFWSNSSARGMYKGDTSQGQVTPVIIQSVLQAPWMEFLSLDTKINQVIGSGFGNSQALSSPVYYKRAVLFPDSEYFIIIDRMEGAEPWIYRTIFRPTSLRITPTVDKNKDKVYAASEVGQVNGSLTIGSTPFNWQVLPFKTETDTGITTDTVKWITVNPFGKTVELNLISEPASDIKVTKLVGRIGGYDAASEVFSPVVWFTSPASPNMYRITALLSRYPDEEAKTGEKILVQGTGNALKIHSSGNDDLIYTGSGTSTFDQFSTDAEVAFVRQHAENTEVTLLDGSYLKYQDKYWINMSKKADYVTVKKVGDIVDYRIQANTDLRGEVFNRQIDPAQIKAHVDSAVRKINTDNPIIGGNQIENIVNSGKSGDPVSYIVKIAKKIRDYLFSFFPR